MKVYLFLYSHLFQPIRSKDWKLIFSFSLSFVWFNQSEAEVVEVVDPPPPELPKFWKAVKDNPGDFTGWTYLLQYVEQKVNITEKQRKNVRNLQESYPSSGKSSKTTLEISLLAAPICCNMWCDQAKWVWTQKRKNPIFIFSVWMNFRDAPEDIQGGG